MTTYLELQDEVEDVLDDTSINVKSYINRALDYVSNFFPNVVIDDTAISSDGMSMDVPDRTFEVVSIMINDEFIKELEDVAKEETAIKLGVQRWHSTNTKIYFTVIVKTTDDLKITFEQSYKRLTNDADVTDVPKYIEPLVIACAVWMYYKKITSAVDTNREKYADVDPDEIRRARDACKKEFNQMLSDLRLEN